MASWSEDELKVLGQVGAYDRAGLTAFYARYPHHSRQAVQSKLALLRSRGKAADVDYDVRGDPFPLYRFG